MTITEIDAEIAHLEGERARSAAKFIIQIAKLREQRRLLMEAARETAIRVRLANLPPEVLSALRQSLPPAPQEAALIEHGFARLGRLRADWTGDGFLAKHVLHKIDKEKA